MQSLAHIMPPGPADTSTHRGARRRTTRYPMHGEVTVTSPLQVRGFVFNASAGGLRIALDRPVSVGTKLDLLVRFDTEETTTERGEVVWARELPDGCLVGLRFVE